MNYKIVTQCRICAGTDLVPWLDLGSQPLANRLLSSPDEVAPTYPLKVVRCTSCSLSQLTAVVDPKEMFTDYPFRAGVSESWRAHCAELVESLPYDYTKGGLVVDIGSNDGTLLYEFHGIGMTTLGVDPSSTDPAENIIKDFWSKKTAEYIITESDYASIITATNVLAHVDDVHEFMEAVKIALADDGLFVVEVPLVQDLIKQVSFDTVYHEHLSYFTGWALARLLSYHELFIVDKYWFSIHGGSIRVIASKKRNNKEQFFDSTADYAGFQEKLSRIRHNWDLMLLSGEPRILDYGVLYGYSASAKATVFMNALKIEKKRVPVVFDDNPDKDGKFIPGIGSRIMVPDTLEDDQYIFIFSWNVKDDIKRRARELGFKGKFIYRAGTDFRIEE